MNRGVLERLPVDQMMAGGSNWWSINNMRPPSQQGSSFMAPNPSNLLPQYYIPPPQSVSSSWDDDNQEQLPESWSQLLMGGMVGDEKQKSGLSEMQTSYKKRMENWEEQLLQHPPPNRSMSVGDTNQDNSARGGYDMYGHENGEFSCVKRGWSTQMMPVSSPTSSVTSLSSNNMLDFSGNKSTDGRHPPPDRSSECNSKATCGMQKKARVQPSSTQPTFKVRKEKLGDRVTALHQLVSPFGKTDTASVLLEAIGYIRFLQGQIEALSLPYLANKSGNVGQQQHVHGDRNCLFPEDPGQLLNDGCKKRKGTVLEKDSQEEQTKDLKSRGLCLVPISCTQQVGSDNAADYWGGGGGTGGGGFR